MSARSRMLLLVLVAFALGGCGTGSEDAQELASLRDRIDRTQQLVAAAEPRAAAYLALEFVGEEPALDGPRTGLVLERLSAAPDPDRSDYPDCVAVHVATVRSGELEGQRVLLAVAVFHDRVPLPAAEWTVGAEIDTVLVPWDDMPESVRSIQRADTTEELDLPMFAAVAPRPRGD